MAVDHGYNVHEITDATYYRDLPSLPRSHEDNHSVNTEPVSRFSESPKSRNGSRRFNYESRKLKAKTSLYNLFNRARSHTRRDSNENDPVAESLKDPHSISTGLISIARATTPSGAELDPLYRRISTRSIRTDAAMTTCHRPHTPNHFPQRVSEEQPEPTLPTLLDVYSDATKVTMAQALEDAPSHRLIRPRKSNASHIVPARASEERRESIDSTKDGRAPSRHSRASLSMGPYPNKIFALVNNGSILQYSEKGGGERLPEKVLDLMPDSAAFASDLVPGRLYVLQVEQKPTQVEQKPTSTVDSHPHTHAVLTKLHSRNHVPRPKEHSMIIILDTAEELASWMDAVRKQIRVLGKGLIDDDDPFAGGPVSSAVPNLRVPTEGQSFRDTYTPSHSLDYQRRPSTSNSRQASFSAANSTNRPGTANNRSRRNSQATSIIRSSPERNGRDPISRAPSTDMPRNLPSSDSGIDISPDNRRRMSSDNNARRTSLASTTEIPEVPLLPGTLNQQPGRTHRLRPDSVVETPRPDSFVPDLPNLWPMWSSAEDVSKVNEHSTASSAKLDSHSTRSSDASRLRKTPAPLRPSPPTPESANNQLPTQPPTPSIAITDFTLPSSVPNSGRERSRSYSRPLRHSTNVVRGSQADHPPTRTLSSSNNPSLSKAGSTPNLRAASAFYQRVDLDKPLLAPLPLPDLGMPVCGLGPPVPPPRAPLPALPSGAVPQRTLSVI